MSGRLENDLAANHLVDDPIRIGDGNFLGCHILAIAQDRDGITEMKNFLQTMRDVNDGDPALFQMRQQLEQVLTFVRGK